MKAVFGAGEEGRCYGEGTRLAPPANEILTEEERSQEVRSALHDPLKEARWLQSRPSTNKGCKNSRLRGPTAEAGLRPPREVLTVENSSPTGGTRTHLPPGPGSRYHGTVVDVRWYGTQVVELVHKKLIRHLYVPQDRIMCRPA